MLPTTLVPIEMAITREESALVTERLIDLVVLEVNLLVAMKMATMAAILQVSNI